MSSPRGQRRLYMGKEVLAFYSSKGKGWGYRVRYYLLGFHGMNFGGDGEEG